MQHKNLIYLIIQLKTSPHLLGRGSGRDSVGRGAQVSDPGKEMAAGGAGGQRRNKSTTRMRLRSGLAGELQIRSIQKLQGMTLLPSSVGANTFNSAGMRSKLPSHPGKAP